MLTAGLSKVQHVNRCMLTIVKSLSMLQVFSKLARGPGAGAP